MSSDINVGDLVSVSVDGWLLTEEYVGTVEQLGETAHGTGTVSVSGIMFKLQGADEYEFISGASDCSQRCIAYVEHVTLLVKSFGMFKEDLGHGR